MSDILLTIFSTPKPFTNPHISVIQNNALTSWVNLGKQVEVFLIGEEEGVADAARRNEVRLFPHVQRNAFGTPLISSMFSIARQNSTSPFLCIINTDVMLLPDCLTSLNKVSQQFDEFVLAGQRWDLEVKQLLEFHPRFYDDLQQRVKSSARRHPPMGSDYFIFPRDCYQHVPHFAIGRAGWDNWMMFKCRFEGWPLIDASADLTVIHQDHDYSHLAGGQPHYRLPETKQNVLLAGGECTIFTLQDASHLLTDGVIRPKKTSWSKIWRELEILPITKWHSLKIGQWFYYLFHPAKGLRFIRAAIKNIFSG